MPASRIAVEVEQGLGEQGARGRDRAVGVAVADRVEHCCVRGRRVVVLGGPCTSRSRAARPVSSTTSMRLQQLVVGGGEQRPVEGEVGGDRVALAARRRGHRSSASVQRGEVVVGARVRRGGRRRAR